MRRILIILGAIVTIAIGAFVVMFVSWLNGRRLIEEAAATCDAELLRNVVERFGPDVSIRVARGVDAPLAACSPGPAGSSACEASSKPARILTR